MDTHRKGTLDEELSETEMSPTLEPYEAEEQFDPVPKKTVSQLLTSVICLVCALAGLAAAAFGVFLILYTLLSRSYIPAKVHIVKDLYFDYTDNSAVAAVDFSTSLEARGRSSKELQTFPSGTRLTIWLELEAAETRSNMNADMFQVLAQIISSNGQIAASVSRPCILTAWSPIVQSIRNLVAAPAVLLGLWREHQILRVPLFSKYPDQPDRPLQSFRAVLKATGPNAQLPHLYSAKVHIKLALGIIGRVLYWLRPGKWNTFAIVMGSISTIVGGLVTTLISIVVWLSISPKSHAPPHGPPQSDDDEPENDTGKQSGISRDSSYSDLGESAPTTSKAPLEKQSKGGKSDLQILEDSLPSAPKISHKEQKRWSLPAS